MRKYQIIGWIITGLLMITTIAFSLIYHDAMSKLKPNEWGDFLAGIFAPIAFLWLTLGYFQQGEELKLNTKALISQQKELEKQVKETELLVRQFSRQATASEKIVKYEEEKQNSIKQRENVRAQPKFREESGHISGEKAEIGITNVGGNASNIIAKTEDDFDIEFKPNTIRKDEKGLLILIPTNQTSINGPLNFDFDICYKDASGKESKKTITFENGRLLDV